MGTRASPNLAIYHPQLPALLWDLLPPLDPLGCTRYAPAFTQKTAGVAGPRRGMGKTG